MKRILLVEDDPNLGFVIQDGLTTHGYSVMHCKDGLEGEDTFKKEPFDLCILDVMLPKKDGFDLARSIRKRDAHIPILFLSAKSLPEDKLEGFQYGGDDYITKPFHLDELICRIEVFLRRANGNSKEDKLFHLGRYQFDCTSMLLRSDGHAKSLTQKEAEVLQMLYMYRHRVLRREEILKKIWGDDDYFMGRSLDVFISKLRKYLKDEPLVEIINHHGVGFRLELKDIPTSSPVEKGI